MSCFFLVESFLPGAPNDAADGESSVSEAVDPFFLEVELADNELAELLLCFLSTLDSDLLVDVAEDDFLLAFDASL